MDATELVLYGEDFWISPYVFSSFITLREKSLPFELRHIALQRHEQLEPAYASRALTARVPSLEHGKFVVAESSAIIEYLEEVFPPPAHVAVLPTTPRDRARARQIMSWLRSDDTAPLREARPTTTMFYDRATKPLEDAALRSATKLFAVSERLLPAGQANIFSTWCIADCELTFMLHRLILNGDDVPHSLRAYAEMQWARPSVREFVEQKRPALVDY